MRKLIYLFSTFATVAALAIVNSGCSRHKAASYEQAAEKDFQAGDYEKAELEYIRVLQLNQKNPATWRRLGTIYYDEGRLPRAFAFLPRASQLVTNDLDTRLKMGLICLSD